MQGHRSKLKATRRRKKTKTGEIKTYWVARGYIPQRRPDGTLARRRIEISLGGDTASARQKKIDELNQGYEDRAINTPLPFARAYRNYIEIGKPVPFYGEQLLSHLGLRQCHEIDDSVMLDARHAIFPENARPSYINRHLYTPVSAILKMALREHAPMLTRPAGHKDVVQITIPDQTWFKAVIPHMSETTAALIMFLTMHGRRLGDALGRRPADFDPDQGTLAIGKTKTGEPLLIDLHPGVVDAFLRMDGWPDRRWLFRDGPHSGNNVRKDILAAVLKANGLDHRLADEPEKAHAALVGAKVAYFTPHEIGRHSFATRMLRAGYSTEYVRSAGGWATIEMVSKRYGHLEKREVTTAVHKVADTFLLGLGGKPGIDNGGKIANIETLLNESDRKCLPK